MININSVLYRLGISTVFVVALLLFGNNASKADFGIEIRLSDNTMIRKEGAMKIVFDHKGEAVLLVDTSPGFSDTISLSPCDLAGLTFNPCDSTAISSVFENMSNEYIYISSFPNPSGNDIVLKLRTVENTYAKVSIVGMDGKTVKHFGNIELTKGENLITWNKSQGESGNIAAGKYIIIVETAHGISTTTQIVVK